MIDWVNGDSRGTIVGCLASSVRAEACSRPPTLKIPVVLITGVSLDEEWEADKEPLSAMIVLNPEFLCHV